MRKTAFIFGICLVLLAGCQQVRQAYQESPENQVGSPTKQSLIEGTVNETITDMKLKINGEEVPVVWERNETTEKLFELVRNGSLEIGSEQYDGFEQVGKLPFSLPRKDHQTATRPGDIVLYQGRHLVMFFGEHA